MNKYIIRRAVAAMAIILIVLLLLAAMPKTNVTQWQTYTVESGDTLWTIARNEYGDTVDVRRMIDIICAENDIVPDKLMPGQVIMVPVAEVE